MRQLCTRLAPRSSARCARVCWEPGGREPGSVDGGRLSNVVSTGVKRRVRVHHSGSPTPCALPRMSRTDLDVSTVRPPYGEEALNTDVSRMMRLDRTRGEAQAFRARGTAPQRAFPLSEERALGAGVGGRGDYLRCGRESTESTAYRAASAATALGYAAGYAVRSWWRVREEGEAQGGRVQLVTVTGGDGDRCWAAPLVGWRAVRARFAPVHILDERTGVAAGGVRAAAWRAAACAPVNGSHGGGWRA
jgi:hypothetical protein